ncbi:MAG: outer membrane protein transport protein [Candidatus Methylomirabilis sp.]|nr:outer membrane protein transport protein [Deltaproteobacteria bacterium]
MAVAGFPSILVLIGQIGFIRDQFERPDKVFNTMPVSKNMLFYVFLLALVLPGTAYTSGFKVDQQGAKALGMANAYAVTADDPSAVYFNPAGLAGQRDPAIYLGAFALAPSTEFRDPFGADEEIDELFLAPHFYLAYPYRNISFGIGIYAPFGLGMNWSETGLTRYQATEGEIDTLNVNPTIAMRIRHWFLVGAGVDYMRSTATLEKMVDQSLVGGTDARSSLEGDGYGWGYNAGVIIIPDERFRFGVSYRSAIDIDFNGSASLDNIAPAVQPLFGGASFRTNARTSIEFPATLMLGVAYKASEKTALELNFEKTYWSSYKSLDIDLENEVAPAGFTDTSEPKDWRDIWAVRAGVEYRAAERISLRGGYVFQNNPVPDHTLEPRLPDSDQHNISLGIGYNAANLVIDAAYMFAYFEDRKVENSILSGEYSTSGHSAGLSIGYKF